jgi:hypothetical protein
MITAHVYTHLMHNLVRWAVRRSGAARQAVVRMDDLFYGRYSEPKPFPAWLPEDLRPMKSSAARDPAGGGE